MPTIVEKNVSLLSSSCNKFRIGVLPSSQKEIHSIFLIDVQNITIN